MAGAWRMSGSTNDYPGAEICTDGSLIRSWPSLTRPPTEGFRGCPAQGRARTTRLRVYDLNGSQHWGGKRMKRALRNATAAALLAAMAASAPAVAQKPGGILRAGHFDSPASMSMLEE